MRTILTLTASAAILASVLGVVHAADTSGPSKTQPVPGATIGTPGAESKGNPIAVPDETGGATINQGSSANATTPGEESKGNTKGPPLTSQ